MTGASCRILSAGLVASIVVAVAGLSTIFGRLLGPAAAEARGAVWPAYSVVDGAKCFGSQQCLACGSNGFLACKTTGPNSHFVQASCSLGVPGGGTCYETYYNCGPLIYCLNGASAGDCFGGDWCTTVPPGMW